MTILAKIQHDWLHDDRERDDTRTFYVHSFYSLGGYPAYGLCWHKGELCAFTMDHTSFVDFQHNDRKTFIYEIERIPFFKKLDLMVWAIQDHVKNYLHKRRLQF